MITIGKATLHNCDCMELLKATPDKFYDLAIVDPPYGIGFDGEFTAMASNNSKKWNNAKEKCYERKDWDSAIPSQKYFNELSRVSKNQIIWGANYFNLPQSTGWIFWDKGTAEGMTLSAGELAWTSFNRSVNKISILWAGFRKVETESRIHPTQKPINLYEWLLTNYAKQGDKILDTHLGSGSHAIACNNLGFELTACELDKDYFDASVKRITQALSQGTLFEPAPSNQVYEQVELIYEQDKAL
jgi:site-specific DNA-methyltransferase (adenine-specific)